ncbi:MAG: HEAT repeat domain-containing protein [Leptolyngbya sp. LCM1.Bin17]|nr:MAG: HEAT repeat domain-containing protein [Leptolyngbya sp. LCM1.Bin17]
MPWLKTRAQTDESWAVRSAAVTALARGWGALPELYEVFSDVVCNDPFEREESWQDNPRQIALKALLTHHRHQPQTLDLLRDRTAHDPDEQLRQWAQKQLEQLEIKNGG